MISAKIIKDSKNEFNNRLTTFILTYPRIIHSEIMTHRMFSRNSASSRAIPFEKMVKSVEENFFIPIAWQKSHKGMQGNEYFTEERDTSWLIMNHLKARDQAVERASDAHDRGLTKQLCNRLLEPFMWHTVILTATDFEGFFELRCPQYYYDLEDKYFKSKKEWLEYYKLHCIGDKDSNFNLTDLDWLKINKGQSEIHLMQLAECMWNTMNESTPELLKAGEWHIPFGDDIQNDKLLSIMVEAWGKNQPVEEEVILSSKIKIVTAMNARISYTVVGEKTKVPNYENDIKLHDKLLESKHFSPFEHIAKCMNEDEYYYHFNGYCRNFRGFIQYRSLID